VLSLGFYNPVFSDSFCTSFLSNSIDESLTAEILSSSDATGNAWTSLEAEFKDRLALNSSEVLSVRCSRFCIPQTHPEDYLERVVSIAKDRCALAGIRFFNLQRDQPYVEVWPNWNITTCNDLYELVKSVRREFSVFSPKSVALWLSPERILKLQEVTGKAKSGQVVIGAHAKYILENNSLLLIDEKRYDRANMKLQAIDSMEFYEGYAEAYAQFHNMQPILRNKVPKTSREDLKRAIDQGLAFHFILNGEEAGLIAAERRGYIGMVGIYFLELFLYEGFRGRKLASHLQRRFVESVTLNSKDFVWGTIDLQNQPSLRTALSLGRRVVSQEVFLALQ
jgi:hypothetical protein